MINSLIKEGSLYAFSDLLRKASPFLLLPIYVSTLNLSEFGKLEYVTLIATLLSYIIGWGSIQGLLRLYEKDGMHAVNSTLVIIFTLSIATLILGLLFNAIFNLFDYLDITLNIFLLCMLYGLILAVNNVSLTILRFEQRILSYAFINIVVTLLQVSLIYYFLIVSELSFLSKIYGLLISNLLIMPILFFFILKKRISSKLSFKLTKETYKFYTPISFSNLLGWGSGSADKIFIKFMLGDELLGVYSFMQQLAQIFKLTMESFLKSLNVFLYKNLSKMKEFMKTRFSGIFIFQVAAICYCFLIISAAELNFFKDYPIIFSLFSLIILSRIFLLASYLETMFFYARIDSKSVAKINTISFLVLLAATYPLVYFFNLYGAAISLIIYSSLNYFLLAKKQNVGIGKVAINLLIIITPWVILSLMYV